jgi:hypothetical protein
MTYLIITAIILIIVVAANGIAVLSGKLRWYVSTRIMYTREYLSNQLEAYRSYRANKALNRSRETTEEIPMTNDQALKAITLLTRQMAELTAQLASDTSDEPTPNTTLAGFAPAITPIVSVPDKPPVPSAPIPIKKDEPLRTKATIARAIARVTLGSDGEITHLTRDDLSFDDHVSFRAPIFPIESTGSLIQWTSGKGASTLGLIIGATSSGATVVCRIGDTGRRIAAYIYKGMHNVKIRSVANITTDKPTPSPVVSAPTPVHVLTPVPVPVLDTPVEAPVPVPTPRIAKRKATNTRLSIPGLNASSRQTFAPNDRLVVFVNASAQLARTSNNEIRWLVATGSKGKQAIDSPTSIRAGFTAYSLQASDLIGYLTSGAYS